MTDFELDEPLPICGNCDSWLDDKDGHRRCMNRQSLMVDSKTDYTGSCILFFPDPDRWPDADHG